MAVSISTVLGLVLIITGVSGAPDQDRSSSGFNFLKPRNDSEPDTSIDLHASGRFLGKGNLTCYSCEAPHCEEGELNLCHNAIRCFMGHVRDADGFEHKTRGCAKDMQTMSFYCSIASYDGKHIHKINQQSAQYAFSCCNSTLCNNATTWPPLPDVPDVDSDFTASDDAENGEKNRAKIIVAVTIPAAIFICLIPLVLYLLKLRHKRRMKEMEKYLNSNGDPMNEFMRLRAHQLGDSTLREYNDDITSGSGFGMPHLQPRTLAKEIRLIELIGKGRYGEVWRGERHGDAVAVKLFQSQEEESFKLETEIYSTIHLQHQNILSFIGCDMASVNSVPYSWLVTKYHANGSLYDYLSRTTVIPEVGWRLIQSAISGLEYLHKDFCTRDTGKPGIAHRDLKSKNILVTPDNSSVIADFGLAVTQKPGTDEVNMQKHTTRVGTKRYMSPEALDFSLRDKTTFEAFKQADMYSFSLVMWEILWRTDLPMEQAPFYALPFFEDVGPDPDFDEMRFVVCEQKKRPVLCEKWRKHPITAILAKNMRQCWNEDPSARLSALRLKKTLESKTPSETSSSGFYSEDYRSNISVSFS